MSTFKAKNLSKKYRHFMAVDSISLRLNSGEVVGLLGPNGAGKTTTFYILAGLIKPDVGQIDLDQQDLTHSNIAYRARIGIGYLPQEPSIFRRLSVKDNIKAVLEICSARESQEKQCQDILEQFNLSHIQNVLGGQLSGGERRRVELARTLALRPRFILLDEPFSGVDPITVLDIKQYIRLLGKQNIGILITDHNVREALGICSRAYVVSRGRIIAHGTPQEIVQNQEVKKVYLGEEFFL